MSGKPLVIFPTYNEIENIEPLLKRLFLFQPTIQVLVVDDHSPDGTGERVESLMKTFPGLLLLRPNSRRGRGLAGAAGFRYALERGYDPVVEMDADGSHDPESVPSLIQGTQEADVVIGSRYAPGGVDARKNPFRKLLSFWANRYLAWKLRLPVKDCSSGFRCFRRSALERVLQRPLEAEGPAIVEEVLMRAHQSGQRFLELPIHFHERAAGQSKLGWAALTEVLKTVRRTA